MIEFEQELPGEEELHTISEMVEILNRLDREIQDREKELAALAARRRKIAEDDIPTALDSAGVTGLIMHDGRKLTVKETLYASIPKKNKGAAAAWLTENGYASLVKTNVQVEFDRGDGVQAFELVQTLKAHGLIPLVSEDMNTASVKAAISTMRVEGMEVPLDLFGAYIKREAVLK